MGKPFFLEVAAHEVDEFVLELHAQVPDFLIGHFEDAFPGFGVALFVEHLAAEFPGIEFLPLRSCPGRHVHAVGNIAYVAFFPGVAFPDAGEHFLRHFAVEPAHTVGLLAGVEGEYTHGEALVGVGVLATHVHEVVPADAELRGIFSHVFSEEALVEVVVACGYGGVYGVERGRTHHFEGNVEVKTLVLHEFHQTLEVEQCGMAFVAVVELVVDA